MECKGKNENVHIIGTIERDGHVFQVIPPENPKQYNGLVVRIGEVDGIIGFDAEPIGTAEKI